MLNTVKNSGSIEKKESSDVEYKYIRLNITKILKEYHPDCQSSNTSPEVQEFLAKYVTYLRSYGFVLEKTVFTNLSGSYKVLSSQNPLGATPDYLKGYYYISDLSSHIPVIALNPQRGEKVLDMCSAPGGKTCHIADSMRNQGILIANDKADPSRKKAVNGLIANLNRSGVKIALVTELDGKDLIKHSQGFDRVLLDAPCTGTGLIGKENAKFNPKNLDNLNNQVLIQKSLILNAIDLLKQGGVLVYSTCSTNVQENEEVINYALNKRKIKLRDLFTEVDKELDYGEPGMVKNGEKRFSETLRKTRRFYRNVHGSTGFFVAKIFKP